MFDFQLNSTMILGLIAFAIIILIAAYFILLRKIYKNLLRNNKRTARKQKIDERK